MRDFPGKWPNHFNIHVLMCHFFFLCVLAEGERPGKNLSVFFFVVCVGGGAGGMPKKIVIVGVPALSLSLLDLLLYPLNARKKMLYSTHALKHEFLGARYVYV